MVQVVNEEAKASGGLLGVGWHHVLVDICKDASGEYGPQLQCAVEGVASVDQSMIGRKKTEFLPLSGEMVGKLWRWGIALGIVLDGPPRLAGRVMTEELYQEVIGTDKNPGTREPISFDEKQVEGRQCCVKVENRKWTPKQGKNAGKPQSEDQIGFNWFALGDPKAAECPIDRDIAAARPDLLAKHDANQKGGAPAAGAAAKPATVAATAANVAAPQGQAGQPAAAAGGAGWGGF